MRNTAPILALVAALVATGCAGPENKLGRGVSNMTEPVRGGEMRRSIEQTILWDHETHGWHTGVARGFNRTMARTFVGIYEVVTFPFPPYDPVLEMEHPVYPDYSIATLKEPFGGLQMPVKPGYPSSYTPGRISSSIFDTDTQLGFSSGEIAPMIPGSRFRIFEY